MQYTPQLVEFVKAWEGLKLVPSGDPLVSGVVDVGYGHVIRSIGDIAPITPEQAEEWLHDDLNIAVNGILRTLPNSTLTQYQFDALVSMVFNLGIGNLGPSTMFRYIRNGQMVAAAAEITKWCRAGGKVVVGLQKRRRAEQRMFEHADYTGRP